ncbi:hypothetical protein HALLA_18170 [Halostagnicola larsenii XH-48]|uniref:DUF8159 domain-containing protein n=1 Tax=Halostagnicola larsenii XH-48 TaxID=797299 RepID=W0JQZ0_9EURY|nr:hypothetical protein [Halostagnicola larsenii]AHG01151.1 hypothetical protein HALLA_18170 [Halostagnicola larsenii XH-48]
MSREVDSPSKDDDDGELDAGSGSSRSIRTNDTTRATRTLSRRSALAGVGTLSLGAVAGCLGSIPGLEGSAGQQLVEPEDPGENPDATPGEFYHLIEEHDIVVDELYHDPDENRLDLFYDSSAGTIAESNEEIVVIYQAYQELIDHGSSLENLYTEIVEPFDEQATGWGVKTEWVTQYLDDEIDENQLWGTIMQSKAYEDGDEPGGEASNESDPSADDGSDTDGNETSGEAGETDDTESDEGGSDNEDVSDDETESSEGSDSTADGESSDNESDGE